jgi:hypothetical protein
MSCQGMESLCFTQSTIILTSPAEPQPCQAHTLTPHQRLHLAVHVLAGTAPTAALARQLQVSRKFVSRQTDIARQALDDAFQPQTKNDEVLFHLPVTKDWLRQFVLAEILIARCSYRGVIEILADLFDHSISLGTVHNIVHAAVAHAREINGRYHLGDIRVGAHDEIFQGAQPVLVGVDTHSLFCYLLRQEDHCDGETWALHLMDLVDRGFAPEAVVADAGAGLRAGHELGLPEVECRGDIFHFIRDLQQDLADLENRAYDELERTEQQRRKWQRVHRQGGRWPAPNAGDEARRLRFAAKRSDAAIALYDDMATLVDWLRHDVLGLGGPGYDDRVALFDFIVEELQARGRRCSQRLRRLCKKLLNQRDDLMAFARVLDRELDRLAARFGVPVDLLRRLLGIVTRSERDPRRWSQESAVQARLRGRFHAVRCAVTELAVRTVRASSLVENLNGRLRNYFTLRRWLGPAYLELLQFFLNHRRLERSDRAERVGKTPAECLTGESHPHWLELLGYRRFRRAA